MAGLEQGDLFPGARGSDDTVAVNERCLVRTRDGHRVILVAGIVVDRYAVGDPKADSSEEL